MNIFDIGGQVTIHPNAIWTSIDSCSFSQLNPRSQPGGNQYQISTDPFTIIQGQIDILARRVNCCHQTAVMQMHASAQECPPQGQSQGFRQQTRQQGSFGAYERHAVPTSMQVVGKL